MAHPALILMYHRVGDPGVDPWGLCVSPDHFGAQLELLRDVAHPVSLRALLDGSAAHLERPVVITFDDGYVDNLENATPILAHYEVPATVFITTEAIGNPSEFWWDEIERGLLNPGTLPSEFRVTIAGRTHAWALGESAVYDERHWREHLPWKMWEDARPTRRHVCYDEFWNMLRPLPRADRDRAMAHFRDWSGIPRAARSTHRTLTLNELRQLATDPLIEIGAHTTSHPNLTALSVGEQRAEIHDSKTRLEAWLGPVVSNFSYPYGACTDDTVALVAEDGFDSACSTQASVVTTASDRFRLPRVQVDNVPAEEFREELAQRFGLAF